MNQPTVIFLSTQRKSCTECRLVLESMGIDSFIDRGSAQEGEYWRLLVDAVDHEAAVEQLNDYRSERVADDDSMVSRTPTYDGSGWGVLVYALTLVSLAILSGVNAYGWGWSDVGPMRAGEVTAGRWTQVVTALTLHADATHLSSNLLFGSLFGFLAGRIMGGGLAWLTIVLAGSLGNALNAFARPPEHVSIGASTAVFAALGILVAHALHPRSTSSDGRFRRFSPFIAGLVMLAFLGTEGERTDVLAHVSGFFVGIPIGWIGCRLPSRWLASATFQWCAAAAATLLIVAAWTIAIAAG